jgi:hypothetical protein
MMNKKFKEKISDSLHRVEGNGGKVSILDLS